MFYHVVPRVLTRHLKESTYHEACFKKTTFHISCCPESPIIYVEATSIDILTNVLHQSPRKLRPQIVADTQMVELIHYLQSGAFLPPPLTWVRFVCPGDYHSTLGVVSSHSTVLVFTKSAHSDSINTGHCSLLWLTEDLLELSYDKAPATFVEVINPTVDAKFLEKSMPLVQTAHVNIISAWS